MCHVGSLLPLSMRTETVQDHPGTEAWMRAPRGRKHNFFFFPRLLPRGGGPTLRFRLGSPLRGALLANTRREERAGHGKLAGDRRRDRPLVRAARRQGGGARARLRGNVRG